MKQAPSHFAALALAGIVAAACGVSLIWVFAVPIYQSPDEPAHLDYALAIYTHGGPFLAQNTSFGQLPPRVHPYSDYLQQRTRAYEISYSPGAKVEPGYGTAEYFAALDRDAPHEPIEITGPNHLAAIYPFGYYSLLAGWIALVRLFSDSLTVTFFAARILSVMLLAVTLVATYGTVRLLNFPQRFALLLTAGIGLFPLTSFISSYVQPDNLSWTLVSLAYYLALRGRRDCWPGRDLLPLGLVLGGLAVTKVQFFVCVATPIIALLAADLFRDRASWRRWLAAAAMTSTPFLLLGSVYLWTVRGTENYFSPAAADPNPFRHYLLYVFKALTDFFYGGTHRSFWGVFGWGEAPLIIHGRRTTIIVRGLIHAFALWTVFLFIASVGRAALQLVRRKQFGAALRLAVENPVMNSLFLFTVVMTVLFARTENRFGAQGRNWLPVILPVFLTGIVYAPRALTRVRCLRKLSMSRAVYTTAVLGGLLIYDAVGGYYALKTIHERFYLPFTSVPTRRTPLSTEPVESYRAARSGNGWEILDAGSYLSYAIDPPGFVHGIRLDFRVINEFRGSCTLRVAWRSGGESFETTVPPALFLLTPCEHTRGITVWTNGPVQEFRIYPDFRLCRFEVAGITVLH